METPTYTSQGIQVYKPQPGEYWKDGLRYRESFGGIIAEIQDQIVAKSGTTAKTYPQNYAGIIAALNDLGALITEGNLPSVGTYPLNWDVAGQDWQGPPVDGTLWFDTRQGRLFIAIDGEYYQANGADGIASVGPEVPTNPPVIGSTWFDTYYDILYVYVGGDNNTWQAVRGAGEVSLTTATLPLSISRTAFNILDHQIIPDVPVSVMEVQKDYNEYLYAALLALDKGVVDTRVIISDVAPTENLYNGTLWYDSSSLEMSIYYEDTDGSQWVPTSVSYSYDEDLNTLTSALALERVTRTNAIAALQAAITTIQSGAIPDLESLETKVTALESHVANHPAEVDLSGYTTSAQLTVAVNSLVSQVTAVDNKIPDLTNYVTSSVTTELANAIAALPTTSEVSTLISAAAPDLSSYVAQAAIDSSISAITNTYLPRTGGTLTGAFVVNKTDANSPAFDFSSEKWYSNLTHKYATNAAAASYASFGTNAKLYEYAWDFTSNEDFCWIYNDTTKVFSITKDGPACSNLYIGDFQENTNDGRVITNKIDVKDRLTKYQTAFENVRQAVSDSTDYSTLRSGLLTALASV